MMTFLSLTAQRLPFVISVFLNFWQQAKPFWHKPLKPLLLPSALNPFRFSPNLGTSVKPQTALLQAGNPKPLNP